MAKKREVGDFDQAFANRLAEHLVSGRAFEHATVETLFVEVLHYLEAQPSKRDAMDIEHLFKVISPVAGELRLLSKHSAASRIFTLIFEH